MKCRNPIPHNVAGRPYIRRCGSCVGCTVLRKSEWTGKALREWASHNRQGWFATLTYSDLYLPTGSDWSRSSWHDQLHPFLRSLRYLFPLRYLCAPDEGDQFGRPHWHLLLYTRGDLDALKVAAEEKWHYGYSLLEPITTERAAYTCGYVTKKLAGVKIGRIRVSQKFGQAQLLDHARQSALEGISECPYPARFNFDGKTYPVTFAERRSYGKTFWQTRCPDLSQQEILDRVKAETKGRIATPLQYHTLDFETLEEAIASEKQQQMKKGQTIGAISKTEAVIRRSTG